MNVSEYVPPPPRPSPPAKPPRKFRSAVIMSAILLGSFVVCLAVLSRHELAQTVSQHVAKTNPPDMRQSKLPPDPATAKAAPQVVQQTQATPPSVFQ
jgi:hypothetical protein